MGMAASQVRLMQLTSRKNSIGRQLMMLSNDKVSLSREMQKVSKNYQNALNSKVLKWSNNSGVSYIDLTYQNLMTPSGMNQNTPYLLTDNSGRVVIDSGYKKYAEMISPEGKPNGDWQSIRTQVLSELTGIDAAKIDSGMSYQQSVWKNSDALKTLEATEPDKKKFTEHSTSNLLKKLGSSTGVSGSFSSGSDWASAYNSAAEIDLGSGTAAASAVSTIIDNISKKLAPYFMDDAEKFQKAAETVKSDCTGLIGDGNTDLSNSGGAITGKGSYKVNVKSLIDQILGAYGNNGGQEYQDSTTTYNNQVEYVWYDIDSGDYAAWKTAHDEWQKKYDEAKSNYESSVNENNQLFSADEESKIKFYDAIFSAIAEKGWTYNNQVNDTDYLNQMLQNNLYTLTTVDRDVERADNADGFVWDNDYSTDIASNFTNVFSVNNSQAQNDALADYEYQKSIINAKETRIDTRMQDLQTEQSAINQMIQGIESVRNDNVERTFSIMS